VCGSDLSLQYHKTIYDEQKPLHSKFLQGRIEQLDIKNGVKLFIVKNNVLVLPDDREVLGQ
jgi:hypothetical protein